MESVKTSVFNIFNAPKSKDVPAGEEIYTWEYQDEKGNILTDSKNVKEEINSFVSRVDYKAQIKRGELELNDNLGTVSKDYTTIPDNAVDIYKYLAYLSTLSKDQVAELLEQTYKTNQTIVQGEQDGNQAPAEGEQIDE